MEPKQYVKRLLSKAVQQKVSDVYLLPGDQTYRIVFKAVSVQIVDQLSFEEGQKVISYLKYQANMSVSEHRRPQSGAIHWVEKSRPLDLRLSTVGDYQGHESLVVRLIYQMEALNYCLLEHQQWDELKALLRGQGLFLFAGPMGSGKSTTMYRLVKETCQKKVVLTIEDPVEIHEPQFLQLQVNQQAGMTYPELLRLGLRHRPQVLIIGEIRDPKTAQIAIEASLSGHLVLATIHAKSAQGVVPRLQQLGVADYYLDQALLGSCYQRLIPLQTGGVAALFDVKNREQLQRAEGNEVSGEWHTKVANAVRCQKITAKVAQTFDAG